MKQQHLVIVLFVLIVASCATSLVSYRTAERQVNDDMSQALSSALAKQQSNVITQDTIQSFNSHLQIAELRGKATIAVDTKGREFKAYANCSEATIFSLSDQRPTVVLWTLTLMWALFCFYHRRHEMLQMVGVSQYGGLRFAEAEGTFYDAAGRRIKLTPMQQQLMEMFFRSETRQLTKTEICDALWPKKPDASETLYTLIRRLRPIIEEHSELKIESDRGKSYGLTIR
jgi:hypothetical protein